MLDTANNSVIIAIEQRKRSTSKGNNPFGCSGRCEIVRHIKGGLYDVIYA